MSKLVYMAGPLFSEAERSYLELMVKELSNLSNLDPDASFFLPHRDGGELGKGPIRKDIFELDIKQVNSARIVVALLDGQDVDSGTCIELGYAYAKGKKIFGLLTDFRAYKTADSEPHKPNLMVWGICEEGKTLYGSLDSLAVAFAQYVKSL
ncbi:MAG: nucleoside 2-deoxyribosyltransferase [Dehalococcoidales bacterium]|nr:nucleoside 2-deoxyribosyltransferase [Dehalococcoidales bacterium]